MIERQEALVQELLADPLDYCSYTIDDCKVLQSELRRQHARIAELEAQLATIRTDEREACAKVCDELEKECVYTQHIQACIGCAAAIRARKD
ncbi:MAG: hypothetical protein KGL39_36010 [Patescibacteria group bacterium]|nr:hypothetical protein [Patescibacteria group bacterium]